MRVALGLLFLVALGSVPGSMLPQQGNNPSGVQQYFVSHPALAPWLNHLGLFNVFGAPWFAAIYLLLFVSLVGCVVPRTFRLAGSARTLPPRAPRHLARLLVQGTTFADTASALDEFHPGRLVSAADLGPFTITLNRFDASYIASGPQRGQPSAFDAQVSYTEQPGGPARTGHLEVNRPLSIDGAKVYLIGHGYAPQFTVTDARGQVVYDAPTPFIPGPSGDFLSEGVVKVPDGRPEQPGFTGVFVPTAVDVR